MSFRRRSQLSRCIPTESNSAFRVIKVSRLLNHLSSSQRQVVHFVYKERVDDFQWRDFYRRVGRERSVVAEQVVVKALMLSTSMVDVAAL